MVFGRRCFRHTHVRSPRGKLHFRGSCTTRIDDNRLRLAGRSLSSFVDRSTPPLALAGWDNYERRQLSPGRASTISFASIASGRLRIVPASVWAFPSSTEFITNTILPDALTAAAAADRDAKLFPCYDPEAPCRLVPGWTWTDSSFCRSSDVYTGHTKNDTSLYLYVCISSN